MWAKAYFQRGRNTSIYIAGQRLGFVQRAQHGIVPGLVAARLDQFFAHDGAIGRSAHLHHRARIACDGIRVHDIGPNLGCHLATVAARGAGITQGGACGVFAACSTRQALHAADILQPTGLCGLGAGFFQGFLLALGFLRLALLVVSQLLLLVQFFQAFFFALGFLLLGLFLLQAFLFLLLQPFAALVFLALTLAFFAFELLLAFFLFLFQALFLALDGNVCFAGVRLFLSPWRRWGENLRNRKTLPTCNPPKKMEGILNLGKRAT